MLRSPPGLRAGLPLIAALSASLASCATLVASDLDRVRTALDAPLDRTASIDDALGAESLGRDQLVAAVLAANPSLDEARSAVRAALERVPQAAAAAEPTLSWSVAPGTIGAAEVGFGQRLSLSQRLAPPGALRLAGDAALADAEAALADHRTLRLRLAVAAASLWDDLELLDRALELNVEHQALLDDLIASAEAALSAGRVGADDPLRAATQLAHVEHEAVALRSDREVVTARINGLLHRSPDASLPPPARPPTEPEAAPEVPPELDHPVLDRAYAEERAASARVELARAERAPTLQLGVSFNTMWQRPEHWLMVELSVALPVDGRRRRSEVAEAEAREAGASARRSEVEDRLAVQIAGARARLAEARHVLRLHRERLLPLADRRLEVARAAFEAGAGGFEPVIAAEVELRGARLGLLEATAARRTWATRLAAALGQVSTEPSPPTTHQETP